MRTLIFLEIGVPVAKGKGLTGDSAREKMGSIREDLWSALGLRERKIERIGTQRITTLTSNIHDLGLSVVLWKEASNRQRTSAPNEKRWVKLSLVIIWPANRCRL